MAKKRTQTKWNKHVKKTMRANPKMSFKNVLKKAKKTYRKK